MLKKINRTSDQTRKWIKITLSHLQDLPPPKKNKKTKTTTTTKNKPYFSYVNIKPSNLNSNMY